ncbi:protein white-like [Saccoglossus kowalevskii]|uniref:Protein white-like n=1 Tax=Saccoglossus kowalevskii TaxID=10224 RepID=A0ABM0N192_SACKO|nr:PREDICTED: protein white-like [Saccoglossus kowalevskii]
MEERDRLILAHRSPYTDSHRTSDTEPEVPHTSTAFFKFRERRRSTIFNNDSITLTWSDISVTRQDPTAEPSLWQRIMRQRNTEFSDSRVNILRAVSGYVKPGMMLTILGPSGSGKSTLLDTLTFRSDGNLSVQGNIMANGELVDSSITSVMAYVQQDEFFITTLTVREHLQFQALLRMERDIPNNQRMTRVEEVIVELGLKECANVRIGGVTETCGISGGERKRLAVASEIITNPPLLICDEPTTGLDSFMARTVVSKLSDLASAGHAVICTMHQPASEVFCDLDHIMFLTEGRCAYMGPATEAVDYFAKYGYKCPDMYNPSDYFIETLSITKDIDDADRQQVEPLCDCYDVSQYKSKVHEVIHDQMLRGRIRRKSIMNRLHPTSSSPYKNGWLQQFMALMWRGSLQVLRDPGRMKLRIINSVITAIFVGIVSFQIPYTVSGAQGIQGLLYVMLYLIGVDSYYLTIRTIQPESIMFFREHFNGMYRTDTYYISKTLAEIPTAFFVALLAGTAAYWMIGLNPAIERYLLHILLLFLVGIAAASLGIAVSAACTNDGVALTVAAMIILPIEVFSGFYINVESIPVYLRWLEYLSYTRYGYECLSITQWYGYENTECNRNSTKCLHSGAIILDKYNFYLENFPRNIAMLFVVTIVFRILAFLFLLGRTYLRIGHSKNQ